MPNTGEKVVLIIVLIAAALGVYFWYEEGRMGQEVPGQPEFADYSTKETFTGVPAAPDFSSWPEARTFQTAITAGAKTGPNFAGRYTVIEWGCGTGCQDHAIVEAETGAIVVYGLPSTIGVDFKIDSRLLVVDPLYRLTEARGPAGPEKYYVIDDGNLKPVLDTSREVSRQ